MAIAVLALGVVAVLALGLRSLGTGVAAFGDFDGGLAVFADKGGNDKVSICHITGSGSTSEVFISVSENAVPAHEAHGDAIDVASADDCGDGDATPSPDPGDGRPDPGDGTPEATPEIVF